MREKADVAVLWREFRAAEQGDREARAGYRRDRDLASGRAFRNWASDANMIGTFIDVLVSFLYAQNPDIEVRAAPQVGGPAAESVEFAQALTIILTRFWRRAGCKTELQKMVRSALTTGGGWLKVIPDAGLDPQTAHRRQSLAADLAALRAQHERLAADEAASVTDRQALTESIARLTARVQAEQQRDGSPSYRNPGVVLDFVRPEHVQVSAEVNSLLDYGKADWVAHSLHVPRASLRERFPRLREEELAAASSWQNAQRVTGTDGVPAGLFADDAVDGLSADGGEGITFARVVELWDRRDGFVKTLVEGVPRYAREPYQPAWECARFYPFFYLQFFPVDGERHPQSLPARLRKLQEEYSSRRSNGRLTAERSVPGLLFNRRSIQPDDVRRIENSVHQELVGLDSPTGEDVRKLFAAKPVPTVDPLVFDTRPVTADMERISGVQEALVQSNVKAKTATEARIQQSGFMSRSSADRDAVEDVLDELAYYTGEIAVQTVSAVEARRLAGPDAFWLAGMSVRDLDSLVQVRINAGSTGKPDRDREQRNWTVALPLVQNLMMQIQQAQTSGNQPLANAMIQMLKETFRRLDERIDVARLIPDGPAPVADRPALSDSAPVTLPVSPPPAAPGVSGGEPPTTSADANVLV